MEIPRYLWTVENAWQMPKGFFFTNLLEPSRHCVVLMRKILMTECEDDTAAPVGKKNVQVEADLKLTWKLSQEII